MSSIGKFSMFYMERQYTTQSSPHSLEVLAKYNSGLVIYSVRIQSGIYRILLSHYTIIYTFKLYLVCMKLDLHTYVTRHTVQKIQEPIYLKDFKCVFIYICSLDSH